MDLSIIIVNWNTRDLLERCLLSVHENVQTFRPANLQTLVVDNASTDGSPAMVRDRFPWVHLIENSENLGFARANNQGIRHSRGRYILLLNSDAEVHECTLTRIVDFLDDVPDAGVLGVRLLNPDGSLQYYPTRTLTALRLLILLLRLPGHQALWQGVIADEQPRPVERVKGACMALRRSAIEDVGLMAEDYFLYAEEDDWCLRFLRSGWKLYYLPSATVTHHGAASTQQASAASRIHLYQSRIQYLRRHFGRAQALLYKSVVWLTYAGRFLLRTVGRSDDPDSADSAAACRRLLAALRDA